MREQQMLLKINTVIPGDCISVELVVYCKQLFLAAIYMIA